MSATNNAVPVKGDFRRYAMLGYVSIALVFGGFGVWASVAPLDRAAVATGQVAVSGDHKVVQHLEGGIVREILVKETQQVKQGDVLFRLQPTEAQANTDILRKQMDAAVRRRSPHRRRADQRSEHHVSRQRAGAPRRAGDRDRNRRPAAAVRRAPRWR